MTYSDNFLKEHTVEMNGNRKENALKVFLVNKTLQEKNVLVRRLTVSNTVSVLQEFSGVLFQKF